MAHVELKGTRPSAIAGSWYPGNASVLRQTIQQYLDNVPAPTWKGKLLGLIAPHAGYMYSGQVAAYAYRQIVGQRFDSVAVISPVHRDYVPMAGAALTAVEAYSTPLGRIPLNPDLVDRLADKIKLALLRSDAEHSLEIQLPFLQVVLDTFDLLPVMMVDQSLEFCRQLGDALAKVIQESGRRVLLVASTDLSHFHSYETAKRLDQVMLRYIEAYDVDGLAKALGRGATEACGGGPVMAVMLAGRQLGANQATVLHYANSGDVTGDTYRVVGYAAAAILAV